jgi:hypothetical protein
VIIELMELVGFGSGTKLRLVLVHIFGDKVERVMDVPSLGRIDGVIEVGLEFREKFLTDVERLGEGVDEFEYFRAA